MSTRFNFENHPGYEKLKEAFRLSNKDFLGSIELVPEENVCFSLGYKRKMAQLIKRQKRPYWKYVNTVGKKIAVIAIAFMMLFGLSMSIKAIREPVVSFIVTIFDKFSELFVDKSEINSASDKIEEIYELTQLPQGYSENGINISLRNIETTYFNGDSEIRFYQSIISNKVTIDTEDSYETILFIKDYEIYYIYKNNLTKALWRNEKYIFEIYCNTEISEEEMRYIISSLRIKK